MSNIEQGIRNVEVVQPVTYFLSLSLFIDYIFFTVRYSLFPVLYS